MREIKFRCWNAHSKIMHDWDELVKKNKIHLVANQQPSYPVMQFTGIKDCNGVDIYEGDIVEIPECNHLKFVEWYSESCCFVFRHLPNNRYSENFYFEEFSKIKVIGNIYQNHELPEQCK